ncbi:hypothetical protein APR12_002226 [Nocardia amikacinitolerans]|nr:hypothetical protein [Nocardia amikacinitolerans]
MRIVPSGHFELHAGEPVPTCPAVAMRGTNGGAVELGNPSAR